GPFPCLSSSFHSNHGKAIGREHSTSSLSCARTHQKLSSSSLVLHQHRDPPSTTLFPCSFFLFTIDVRYSSNCQIIIKNSTECRGRVGRKELVLGIANPLESGVHVVSVSVRSRTRCR
ncbi:hypothetical protein Droror1_Dr00020102, partial [Drosera rotundifolia]